MVGQQRTTNQKVVVGKPVNKMIKLKTILKEKLDNNEYQMVDGVIDILNQVLDVENRKSIADNMVRQFKDEGIKFDYSKFYNAIGCYESMVKESTESMKKELMQQLKWVDNQIKKAKNDSDVRKYTRIKNDTLSKLDHIKKTGKYENVNEDGFPGGVGVGLTLPGGYINGAPSYDKVKSTKKRIQNDKNQRYTKVEQK